MVNMASGIQNYQQAQQLNPLELEKKQIENQVLRQTNDERLKMQEFIQNPDNWQTDGIMDLKKINRLGEIAPLTGPARIKELTGLHTDQSNASKARQDLNEQQRAKVANVKTALGFAKVDDPQQVIKAYQGFIDRSPNDPEIHRLLNAEIKLLNKASAGDHITKDLLTEAGMALPQETQRTTFGQKATLTGTGSELKETITTPQSITGQAPNIRMTGRAEPLTIAPGSQYVATGRVDQNNNPTAYQYDQSGKLLGEVTIPAGVTAQPNPQGAQQGAMPQQGGGMPQQNAPQAPVMPSNAPVRMRPGETADTLQNAQAIRTRSAAAAADVPNQQFNSNQIIKIADDVISGKGAGAIANLTGGYAALPFGGDNATNLQQLGHYMALQTAALSRSSGLSGTDAANQIAGQIAGTTDWTAPAIKQTARVNRALSTATSLFNQGVENEFNKTKDPFAARDFQNKWSQIADVNAIRLYDAMKNNDKDGMKEVVNAVGGPDSIGYKNLLNKIKFMGTLVKGQ
jgi:YD repeat-containing protein